MNDNTHNTTARPTETFNSALQQQCPGAELCLMLLCSLTLLLRHLRQGVLRPKKSTGSSHNPCMQYLPTFMGQMLVCSTLIFTHIYPPNRSLFSMYFVDLCNMYPHLRSKWVKCWYVVHSTSFVFSCVFGQLPDNSCWFL